MAEEEALRKAAEKVLNPEGLSAYAGPVGGIHGTVRVSGEGAPLRSLDDSSARGGRCPQALEDARRPYRADASGGLADVLISVTKYGGYVPPPSPAVSIEARDCQWDRRTVAITLGQRLDVFNRDEEPYLPRVLGIPAVALRVALPGGAPVPLFFPKIGHYVLRDETRPHMSADVFVLAYPTATVSDRRGAFSMDGIPTGTVQVSVFSPALGKTAQRSVEIRQGENQLVDFSLEFVPSQAVDTADKPKAAPREP